MHELAIAQNIIDTVNELKKEYSNIKKVTVVCGKLQQIVPDSLIFYLDIIKKERGFENTEFIIKENKLKIKCKNCNKISMLDEITFICPACNSNEIEILNGNELYIEKIEITWRREIYGNKSLWKHNEGKWQHSK